MRRIGIAALLWGCIKHPHGSPATGQKKTTLQGSQSPPAHLSKKHTHFDKSAIVRVINSHSEALAACYKKPRFWQPPAAPRILVEFVIKSNDGAVSVARSKEDSFHLIRNRDCILKVFRGMQFPAGMTTDIANDRYDPGPEKELGIVVTYPIVFELE